MKAINLIPADARRARGGAPAAQFAPSYGVIGLLVVALALVTIYVLSANAVTERKAKLAALRTQVAETQAQAARLSNYAQFQKLAQARVETVRQIASTRFDWHATLDELSRVFPANTSLQSLIATVAPGAGVSSGPAGGVSTGALRNDINAPALEMKGCSRTQDDVARFISRLRLMNGVARVTLADSQKPDSTSGPTASTGPGGTTCGQRPSFDLVVFFQPLPGASSVLPGGSGSASGTPAPTTAASTTPASTTPASSTVSNSSAAHSGSATPSAQPVSTPPGAAAAASSAGGGK